MCALPIYSAPARLHDLLKVAPITPLLSGIQCRCMGGLPGRNQHPPTRGPIQSGNCPLWGRKNPTMREPADKTVAAGTALIPAFAGLAAARKSAVEETSG